MTRKRALVVLSGGQDSTTCLFLARTRYEEIHCLTFDYGQRHDRELEAATRVAALAGVKSHETLRVGAILDGTSPLTDRSRELEQYRDYDTMDQTIGDRVELTFVPMRNPLFLVLAANRAAVLRCDDIVVGVCEADNANYPDCRENFLMAQQDAINLALGLPMDEDGSIRIIAPLLHVPKAKSIRLAMETPGAYPALAWSHTAYDGSYPPTGRDHATVLRAHGFAEAQVPDPLIARAVFEGRMECPVEPNYRIILDRLAGDLPGLYSVVGCAV